MAKALTVDEMRLVLKEVFKKNFEEKVVAKVESKKERDRKKRLKTRKYKKDLDGKPIIPWEDLDIYPKCLKCKKDCKQRVISDSFKLLACNYDPINPGKKRGRKKKVKVDRKA